MTAQLMPREGRVPDQKDSSLLIDNAYVAGEWVEAMDCKTFTFQYSLVLDHRQRMAGPSRRL